MLATLATSRLSCDHFRVHNSSSILLEQSIACEKVCDPLCILIMFIHVATDSDINHKIFCRLSSVMHRTVQQCAIEDCKIQREPFV